jgi:hypothetical protein
VTTPTDAKPIFIAPEQCRAARRVLTLSREDLAAAVDISSIKLVAFEIGILALSDPERARLRGVFELAGIEFDLARGARLRRLDSVA